MPDELSGPPAVVSTDTVFSVAVEDTRDAPAGSGHSAETPLPQLDRSDALFAPDDTRYRRPLVVRRLRTVGQWCWIILAAYPANGIYIFIGDINAGQPFAFHTAGQAFYLDRIVPAVFAQPLYAVPPIAAVALLALIARICFLDHQRERAEMERRAKRDQRIIEYDALAQHAAQAAEGAAIATAGAIGGVAVSQVIERAGEVGQAVGEAAVAPLLEAVVALKSGENESQAPQGPPFDEALLPAPEHFIGRVDDRPWLVERLKVGGTTSITALGGIGGIGKTALAAVALREARDAGHFRDGIAVILCQDKTDPIEVLRLALTRFDPYRREPEATDAAGLTDAARRLLAGKDALIVFDNVEPALSDRLAELINPLRAGDATILLTARQRLPSSVVPQDASREPDLLSDDEALDLFAQAYGLHDAAMLSAADRAAAAARIVQALANHTLAVKLAGAYAADCDRPLDTLAGELEANPLDVPGDTGERAVALIFSQSTDQLPEHARRLFAALAAFPTLEFGRAAALKVAELLNLIAPDRPNPVDVLVRRVLLDPETNGRMPPESDRERLRLHPLLGHFAAEQLRAWPEDERSAAYLAVATHYAEYANETSDAALGPDELNITGALEWAHENGQDTFVVALCTGMQYYWGDRSRTRESLRYLPWGIAAADRLASASGARDDRLQVARLELTYGQTLQNTGKLDAAEAIFKRNLGIMREVGDPREEGVALSKLGDILVRRGDLAGAQSNYEAYLRIMREVGDLREEGVALSLLGQIALGRGQLDVAADYFAQSLVIRRAVQDRQGEGVDLGYLGMIADALNDVDSAEKYYRDCLALMRDVQDALNEAAIALILGRFLVKRRGDRDAGCALIQRAIHIRHDLELPGEDEARAAAEALSCDVE